MTAGATERADADSEACKSSAAADLAKCIKMQSKLSKSLP